MGKSPRTPGRRPRFTLIEMLVVIAIIAILAAMLSPSLMKALDASKRISCQNNLHQQYLALVDYANDFDDRLPPSTNMVPEYPLLSSATDGYKGFLYFTNNYLNIATKKVSGNLQVRVSGAMNDVLSCPGVSQHVPTSEYANAFAMVEYTPYYVDPTYQSRPVRLSRVGGSTPFPRMLSCDRLFTGEQEGNTLQYIQSRYVIGHRSQGGNVLAGDGSIKWGAAWDVFPMEWDQYTGNKLSLPVRKYLVSRASASKKAETYAMYSPDPETTQGWKFVTNNAANNYRIPEFY